MIRKKKSKNIDRATILGSLSLLIYCEKLRKKITLKFCWNSFETILEISRFL